MTHNETTKEHIHDSMKESQLNEVKHQYRQLVRKLNHCILEKDVGEN